MFPCHCRAGKGRIAARLPRFWGTCYILVRLRSLPQCRGADRRRGRPFSGAGEGFEAVRHSQGSWEGGWRGVEMRAFCKLHGLGRAPPRAPLKSCWGRAFEQLCGPMPQARKAQTGDASATARMTPSTRTAWLPFFITRTLLARSL